jgi:hypothetical protein
MPYSIHTYKDILESLKKIEKEDNNLRNLKAIFVSAGVLLGLSLIVILSFTSYNSISAIELITSYGATISLGPVFGFIYYSSQTDLISKRKQEFWDSLINNFSIDKSFPFTNEEINEQDLRKVLMEKINEKINETLKYEQ